MIFVIIIYIHKFFLIHHETIYFHFGSDRALRKGNWKLVSAKGGKWELYDLSTDPGETANLAKRHPDRVKDMADRYETWRERVGAR